MFSANIQFLNKLQIYTVQILFGFLIVSLSNGFNVENVTELAVNVARAVLYLYIIRASGEVIQVLWSLIRTKTLGDLNQRYKQNLKHILLFVAAVGFLVYRQASVLTYDLIILYIASLVLKYPDMGEQKRVISYGTGMACSFYEGYLALMLPSDGHDGQVGFVDNIRLYEANESVRIPVRRLFMIITRDLYCPPDLKAFNKPNRPDLPWLEACKPMAKVVKDVAGVKSRVYRNSVYKIHRPHQPAVYVAAECATALHTLHRVLAKQALYKDLEGINKDEVVNEFCSMLTTVLRTSPEAKDTCEVIYFDNTDPEANLAQVLLDRIKEIEPNLEEIISNKVE